MKEHEKIRIKPTFEPKKNKILKEASIAADENYENYEDYEHDDEEDEKLIKHSALTDTTHGEIEKSDTETATTKVYR